MSDVNITRVMPYIREHRNYDKIKQIRDKLALDDKVKVDYFPTNSMYEVALSLSGDNLSEEVAHIVKRESIGERFVFNIMKNGAIGKNGVSLYKKAGRFDRQPFEDYAIDDDGNMYLFCRGNYRVSQHVDVYRTFIYAFFNTDQYRDAEMGSTDVVAPINDDFETLTGAPELPFE